jgi:hypothetical protein
MQLGLLLLASPAMRLAPPAAGSAGRLAAPAMRAYDRVTTDRFIESAAPYRQGGDDILVQGKSLRTWSYRSAVVEQVQVFLSTEGRPMDADVEIWNGPDNSPFKMRVFVDDGAIRPFSAVIQTPRGPNTVAIRNLGQVEFPIVASCVANHVDAPSSDSMDASRTVPGGALRTFPFDPSVESVQILMETDGRPLNARIELLQGPTANKQVVELYSEDGRDRPFFCVLETPGDGNVVRIINTAPVEFPMFASVVPFSVDVQYPTRSSFY